MGEANSDFSLTKNEHRPTCGSHGIEDKLIEERLGLLGLVMHWPNEVPFHIESCNFDRRSLKREGRPKFISLVVIAKDLVALYLLADE